MVLCWCATIFCRLAAAWFPLLCSSLLWQSISPARAIPSCPRSCSCPGIKEVHCTFRHLTTIPNNLPKDIKRLNLGYNSMKAVEVSELGSLRQLEMLMLHGNDITTVHPGAFYTLRSLQILKLSYNKLTSVNRDLFEGLAGLVRLHLDHNLIDFIEPYSFSGLTSLKLLQLEGNLLKEIHPHAFITVSVLGSFWTSGLKYLYLADNLLEQLPPAALRTAPRLELLSVHGNPWMCDCQLHWLIEWSSKHEGIIKCKKERGTSETCPQCSSPQLLNGTLLLGNSRDKFTCERPTILSPLKQQDNPVWAESEAEPDVPYTKDYEKPLGQLTYVLSDSHGNSAHIECDVLYPRDSSPITLEVNPLSAGKLTVNVSLVTVLECEIDREILQNLWKLVAYYYESPAVLVRGQQRENASRVTYQYTQAVNENSPYFTDLKGYLVAEPLWLLQPRVTLKLNRQQTTTKKLVMDFTTVITRHLNSYRREEDDNDLATSWALIRRGTSEQIQTALDGSKVHMECSVVTSDPEVKVEWILPDFTIVQDVNDKMKISEKGGLIILNATLYDSGIYHCMVRTKASVDLMPLRLTVKERFISPSAFNGQKIVIEKGHSLFLPCEVNSVQPSHTIWYLPKNQILLPKQQMRRAEVMENGTLVVRRLTQDDSGEYSCLASNLYGVDMLSHMVEVTGEKSSDKSQVQAERHQQILPVGGEGEEEGSGEDYQEIIQPFVTQVPKKVRMQQRKRKGFSKRIRMKDFKRKPNKSVKDIDPDRWAEILAKVKSKPNDVLPTHQALIEPNTVTVLKTTSKPSTSAATTITITFNDSSPSSTLPDLQMEPTHFQINSKANIEANSTEKKLNNRHSFKTSESLSPRSTEATIHPAERIIDNAEAVTDPPAIGTPRPVNWSENEPSAAGRRTYNLVPGQSNRRRLPYRRRKPQMRRARPHGHPFYHSSNKTQATLPPNTTSTLATTMTTTSTTTTTNMTVKKLAQTTVEPAEIPTEQDKHEYSQYNNEDDFHKDLYNETTQSNELHISFTTAKKDPQISSSSARYDFPTPKTAVIPWRVNLSHPTQSTVKDTDLQIPDRPVVEIKMQTLENSKDNKNLTGSNKQETLSKMNQKNTQYTYGQETHTIHLEGTESSKKEEVTQNDNRQDGIQLTTQNTNNWPSLEQTIPTQTRASSSKIIISNSTKEKTQVTDEIDKKEKKPKAMPETHIFSTMEPVHPWLHHNKQGRGQTTSYRIIHSSRVKGTGRQGEVSPGQHSHPPSIFRWPSHHYLPLYPKWPGQGSVSQRRQGPGAHPLPTQRFWPFPNTWTPLPLVTNQPEITAETLNPSSTLSGATGKSRSTLSNPHLSIHHQTNIDERTQMIDQLLLARLRNRYRQVQLDRIIQLGRMVTPKPHLRYHNPPSLITPKPSPSPYRPYIPQPPAPTASYGYTLQTLKPGAPHGVAGRLSTQQPTVVLSVPRVLEAESRGVNPRITTVNTTTFSVLAEMDVFLPCKAKGNPEPVITWTKISTGATLPANTKHGPRFEVFKNGTFVIKNIQLQDKGQYLCTAQNRFGSDRMVITLAVQMEAPRIQLPKATEITIYLGKSVTFDCFASGKPPAKVSWILPDRTFVREIGTIHTPLSPISLLQNGTLHIHSPNFYSKGNYKCIASNAAGAHTITYHLNVAAMPPSISEETMDTVIIQQGRNMYVHCSVNGGPVPTQKWTLPAGIQVKPSQFLGRRLFVFPNGTLYIKNVLPADAGRYECLATNSVGTANRTVLLDVKADSPSLTYQSPAPIPLPPILGHGMPSHQHSISAMYGSAVFLHCPESTGSTRGTIWQLPSKTIIEYQYSPERPIKVFRNGTLRIFHLTDHDVGNYLCVFHQTNGEKMELFQVEVKMTPPRIEHVWAAKTRINFGENFQVDCAVTGLPDPEVSWSLPDGTFINNALLRNQRYVISGNGTLFLQQMGKKDEGDYTCIATNKLGKDERKVSVKVGPNIPKIHLKSQSLVTVKLGESAKLSCQATGEPSPKITWISPKNDMISMSSDKFQILEDGMLVNNVKLADEGKYACVAQNSAGNDVKNMNLEVEQREPYINDMKGKSTSKKVLAVSYQTALLDCRAAGKPQPRVWWVTPYGHSLPTPYLGGRFKVHQNGSLELRGLRKTDEGSYMCLAKSNLGEASLLVELDVASLAEKPSFAVPNIEILPIKQEGGLLSLQCPAHGRPKPEFAWILPNGTMLAPGVKLQRFTHHLGNGTLQIAQPVASDKGVYRCLAKNIAGLAEKRYALEAGRKPIIRGSAAGVKIAYSHNLNLPCTVDGWPQASITWSLPNGLVLDKPQNIGRVSFLASGALQVTQVATFDKGTYVCKASNSFGSSTLSYPVTVMVFPPRITSTLTSITRVNRGSPVKLNCMADGIPKPDISWTLPGRTTLVPHSRFTVQGGVFMTEEGTLIIQNPVLMNSGIYKCNAKNRLGTDFKSTYIQVM